MRSFPWLRPFATDLWGGLTDLQIQGLCISLLTGPFKKILRCYWPTFSTDSQLGAFVSTALANLSSRRFRGDGNASSLFGLGRVSLRMAITNLLPSTSRQERENFCFGVVAKTYVSTPVIT